MGSFEFPWLAVTTSGARGFRHNVPQTLFICLLVVCLGVILQDLKLGALDAAGRQFLQTDYASKVGFLAAFGLCKACSNVCVGYLAGKIGKKWTGVAGWCVALLMPAVLGPAPSSGRGWTSVMVASGLLGIFQGLTWSTTIMMMIDLFDPARAGTASGINETIGYTSSAIFAPLYGSLEQRRVSCRWVKPAGSAPDACKAASGGMCSGADTWVAACIGYCQCFGYSRIVTLVALAMVVVGLVVNTLLVRDTAYLIGGRASVRYEQLRPAADDDAGGEDGGAASGRQKAAKVGILMAAGSGSSSRPSAAAGVPISSSNLSVNSLGSGNGGGVHRRGSTDGDGHLHHHYHHQRSTRDDVGDDDDDEDDSDKHRIPIPVSRPAATFELAAPRGAHSSGRVIDHSAHHHSRSLWQQFVHVSYGNRSTALVCLAGFMSNVLTSLAWGLLLSWARDALAIPGPGRNLLTSSYSFLKGLVQFATGLLSDHVGRKWPMALGLAINAAGLLTAAFGAGFDGLFDADVTPASLRTVQYGYLMLAGCLMGAGAGIMYPVFAAAIVDHSTDETKDMSIATFRFWRDLGYVLGALAGVVADLVSAEAAMIVFAGLVLATGAAVALGYTEKLRSAPAAA